ncbi:MAG: ATP-binding protein [Armatimonadota bacterium]
MQESSIGTDSEPLPGESPAFVEEHRGYLLARWPGTAGSGAILQAELDPRLAAGGADQLVLDLSGAEQWSAADAEALTAAIRDAQRRGCAVSLVRCPDQLYRQLQLSGLEGGVRHCGSLGAATGGLLGQAASLLDLYVRSAADQLPRVRAVTSAVLLGIIGDERAAAQLQLAIGEAVTNAILHGSPEGPRNHVRISLHVERGALVVDVADQGPGFDPDRLHAASPEELSEHGYGVGIMRGVMDRVEFFRDETGMLVRLTKLVPTGAGG